MLPAPAGRAGRVTWRTERVSAVCGALIDYDNMYWMYWRQVNSPRFHEPHSPLKQVGAHICAFDVRDTSANAASANAFNSSFSAHHERNEVRNPCIVASMPNPFNNFLGVMFASALTVGDGNSKPVHRPASALRPALQAPASTAVPRCSRSDSIVSAGRIHTPACRSTAPSGKPSLSRPNAGKIVYSISSLVAGHALDVRIFARAHATSR